MLDPLTVRFLIDECVTIDLAEIAISRGFIHSAHVSRRKLVGYSDHGLMKPIISGNWTLVTANGDDFRTPPGSNSKRACYTGAGIHAGLVCLNLPDYENYDTEVAFFEAALDFICNANDLINKCVEVDANPDDSSDLRVIMYDYPTIPSPSASPSAPARPPSTR